MWPLAYGYSSTATIPVVGNMTAYCDRANMHDYYFPDDYTSPIYDVSGDIQVVIPPYLANYRLVCNRTPWVTTETGWQTPYAGDGMFSKEVNEDVQAKLLLIDFFDHAELTDCQAVYLFALEDGGVPPGWGVFDAAGILRKPQRRSRAQWRSWMIRVRMPRHSRLVP